MTSTATLRSRSSRLACRSAEKIRLRSASAASISRLLGSAPRSLSPSDQAALLLAVRKVFDAVIADEAGGFLGQQGALAFFAPVGILFSALIRSVSHDSGAHGLAPWLDQNGFSIALMCGLCHALFCDSLMTVSVIVHWAVMP